MAKRIAFYSYKGGVGRSIILANAAVLLAQRGRRVVCVDFDLEASGLHTIFQVQPRNNIDLISVLLGSQTITALVDISHLVPDIRPEGQMWLLPTISENITLQRLSACGEEDRRARFKTVLKDIESTINPHYILMDCRTGMADTFYFSLDQADALVCVLRPNKQNVDGIKHLFDILDRKRKPQFLALSQVPDIPSIESKLKMFESQLGGSPPRHFGVKIPLLPELALGETVAAISMPGSLAMSGYNAIADWISGV